MSDRPRFTRKARARIDAEERARLIAEIAGETSETFDLPHVEEQPIPAAEQLDAEFEELWEPDLEPADTPRLAAEDMFAVEAEVEEIVHEAVDFDETYLTPDDDDTVAGARAHAARRPGHERTAPHRRTASRWVMPSPRWPAPRAEPPWPGL
ncbi:MAG: hypothetical protein R3D85_07245 [Paracoccaceae bacterium]